MISKFQVGYMYFTALKQNKAFKDQVKKTLDQYPQNQQFKPQTKSQRKIILVLLYFS